MTDEEREQEAVRAAHRRAIGAVDADTLRIQAEGERVMREERWLAEFRSRIRVSVRKKSDGRTSGAAWLPDWLRRIFK